MKKEQIPVTVFTGYLGSGKTTVILNLLKSLPQDYKVVLIKNEFGNVDVDGELARDAHVEVREVMNGCICCVLVGKLNKAIYEILETMHPDRIIVETSGSAYPGPIALELKRIEGVYTDGIVSVVDVLNFTGYQDKSITAKMQMQFTDIILINKHEDVDEYQMERVLDDVYELNPTTLKVKTYKGVVSPDLIFGIDSKLGDVLAQKEEELLDRNIHHHNEVEVLEVHTKKQFERKDLVERIKSLSKSFYRVKGFSQDEMGSFAVNCVNKRCGIEKITPECIMTSLVMMGEDIHSGKEQVQNVLEVASSEVRLILDEEHLH
jgi:G3E family GTPase